MATDKPITGFDPLDVADVESDDLLVVVDVHDTSQSSSGSTKTLTLAALLGSVVDLTMSGLLTFSAAASKIIPGATSFSIRNHGNSADNLLVADNGNVTARGSITATASTVSGASQAASQKGAQFYGTGSACTVAKQSGTATITSLSAIGTSTAGQVTFTVTGGGSLTLRLSYPTAYSGTPHVYLQPRNSDTVAAGAYPTNEIAGDSVDIAFSTSLSTVQYSFHYFVCGEA